MWYNELLYDPIDFDFEGVKYKILPVQPLAFDNTNPLITTLPVDSSSMLDEICSRREIYGEGAESEVNRIFMENVLEMVEYEFDLSRLKRLRIPL